MHKILRQVFTLVSQGVESMGGRRKKRKISGNLVQTRFALRPRSMSIALSTPK